MRETQRKVGLCKLLAAAVESRGIKVGGVLLPFDSAESINGFDVTEAQQICSGVYAQQTRTVRAINTFRSSTRTHTSASVPAFTSLHKQHTHTHTPVSGPQMQPSHLFAMFLRGRFKSQRPKLGLEPY